MALGNINSDYLNAASMSISEYLGLKTVFRGHILLKVKQERLLAYKILQLVPEDNENIKLVITDYDIYHPGYNFLFGLAMPQRSKAIVSIYRLRSDDYCLELERLIKETLHELGHILELGHCETMGCVMNFSNTVWEVDEKNAKFCRKCIRSLETKGFEVNSKFDHWEVIRKTLKNRRCL